jgi:hypothetical protein
MKICSIIGLLVLSILVGPMAAMGFTIDDSTNGANTYWGGVSWNGNPSGQDVIGNAFDVDGMNVRITGSTMTVEVIGPYFPYGGGPGNDGDLYFSSKGWKHTADSPHFASDTFTSAEGWDYVIGVKQKEVIIDGIRSFVPVTGVYKLDFTENLPDMNDLQYTTVTLGILSAGRALQAWKGGYGDFVETATVTPDYLNSMLTYTFDISFLADPNNMGFHWTMYCGNDVVEGEGSTRVPEPRSLFLLGLGLVGLCVYRRRTAREIA